MKKNSTFVRMCVLVREEAQSHVGKEFPASWLTGTDAQTMNGHLDRIRNRENVYIHRYMTVRKVGKPREGTGSGAKAPSGSFGGGGGDLIVRGQILGDGGSEIEFGISRGGHDAKGKTLWTYIQSVWTGEGLGEGKGFETA